MYFNDWRLNGAYLYAKPSEIRIKRRRTRRPEDSINLRKEVDSEAYKNI